MLTCKHCRKDFSPPLGDPAWMTVLCPACERVGARVDLDDLLGGIEARPWATYVLLGLNGAMFVILLLGGGSFLDPSSESLLRWGANFGPLTLTGQWWRVLSSMFLHIGVFHLAVNMWCLWTFGKVAERLCGTLPFLVFYLASGFGGALASLWWNPMVVSAGASGALFGIGGALAAFFYFARLPVHPEAMKEELGSVASFLGYNVYYGLTSTGIDNAAHLGGLFVGALGGAALFSGVSSKQLPVRVGARAFAVFVAVAAGLLLATAFVSRTNAPLVRVMQAAHRFDAGQKAESIRDIEEVLRTNSDVFMAHWMLCLMLPEVDRAKEGIPHCQRALKQNPDAADHRLNLALGYWKQGQHEKALNEANRVIKVHPEHPRAYLVQSLVLDEMGRHEEAENAMQKARQLGALSADNAGE